MFKICLAALGGFSVYFGLNAEEVIYDTMAADAAAIVLMQAMGGLAACLFVKE